MENRTQYFFRWAKANYYFNYFYGIRNISNVKDAQNYAYQIDKRILRKILHSDNQYIVLFEDDKTRIILYRFEDAFYLKSNDRDLVAFG